MEKTVLKDFAVYAEEKLINDIKNKAELMGITEDGINNPIFQSNKDMKIFDMGQIDTYGVGKENTGKYNKLIRELKKREKESGYKKAYKTLIEEVAYTWFNRIIAIRFMEVNNYMPDKMRVLSSGEKGAGEPEFITRYRNTDIGITDEEFEKLDKLKKDGSIRASEEMFRFMFIKQCNALNKNLPELFEKIDDYAKPLLTISYSNPEGVIYKLIEEVGEEPFNIEKTGQVETIGWLYQYYNTVSKPEADLSDKKVDKDILPVKTRLFTPRWIVKYMVQNSLGRLWIERRMAKDSDKTEERLAEEYGWKYYIPEAEQTKEKGAESGDIRANREHLKIEDIKFIDPSMGSGHILMYAFEMLIQFYLEEGYTEDEAAESIIRNNLYGLDIDEGAYKLACFSLAMKGRQYIGKMPDKNIENNLYYFIDSKNINKRQIDFLGGNIEDKDIWAEQRKGILETLGLFENGTELGSIIKINKQHNYDEFAEFIQNINEEEALPLELVGIEKTQRKSTYIIKLAKMLSNEYDIAVTNPPYLGLRRMSTDMKKYVENNYPGYKYDLFSVFTKCSFGLLSEFGLLGFMTSSVWMYIDSYKPLRKHIIDNHGLINLIELKKGGYKDASVDIVAFVIRKHGRYKNSRFLDLGEENKSTANENIGIKLSNSMLYEKDTRDFKKIPGYNFAYWVGDKTIENFKTGKHLEKIGLPRQGMATTDNAKFIRNWYEVNLSDINLLNIDRYMSGYKWYPYNKGGGHRNWYGNNLTVINWENDGYEVKKLARSKYGSETRTIKNQKFYFKEGITYSFIGTTISARKTNKGFLFDVAGSMIFLNNEGFFEYLLALLYSTVSDHYISLLNPTINIQVGNIKNIPVILNNAYKPEIDSLVQRNISISKADWDSFEISWNFRTHPLLDGEKQGRVPGTIEAAYNNWKKYTDNNFAQLKQNEKRLNKLFIEIYDLENELIPEVPDRDITVTKIFDDRKDIYEDIRGSQHILTGEDVIKSLISYGVGCIFGRYSLDEEGLIYAGGEFCINRYGKFKPVEDNIAIITDEEYFEDDLVNRFIKFIEKSFGKKNLNKNIRFIADSLKGKGTPKEKIRSYFVSDFYRDHIQIYKKRPIYWLYDSSAGKAGKQGQNAFKALIYMHRYDENTTGRVRTDYLHNIQKAYENRINSLKNDIVNSKDLWEMIESEKELKKVTAQYRECIDYDKKLGHIAFSKISIRLDEGVKTNYEKVQTDDRGKKYKILFEI